MDRELNEDDPDDSKDIRLTLMEEVLLLGLKDKEVRQGGTWAVVWQCRGQPRLEALRQQQKRLDGFFSMLSLRLLEPA